MQGDGRKEPDQKLKFLAEYDETGSLLWISTELALHLGVDNIMSAGENLRDYLPSPYNKQFLYNISMLKHETILRKHIRFNLPNAKLKFAECYHFPVYNEKGKITKFKIAGRLPK